MSVWLDTSIVDILKKYGFCTPTSSPQKLSIRQQIRPHWRWERFLRVTHEVFNTFEVVCKCMLFISTGKLIAPTMQTVVRKELPVCMHSVLTNGRVVLCTYACGEPEVHDPLRPYGHHSRVVVHPQTRLDTIVVSAKSANQRARHRVVYLYEFIHSNLDIHEIFVIK
jgi:hypothetical protein